MKEKKMKRTLIPDPVRGLLDIQVAGSKIEELETQGYAIDETNTASIKTFYDPNFKTENKDESILSIYENKKYGGKKVPELKEMCRRKNLPVGGTKKELIDRLHEHNVKIKQEEIEQELKIAEEERVVVDKHKNTAIIKIENNIKRLTKIRLQQLDTLVKAQQTFDATETELNEMKAVLKSLEKVL